ncbi:MAG TPA: cytochrome c3 family protein [bacterium]
MLGIVGGLLAWLVMAPSAWATIQNVKSFKAAYPDTKAVTCKACHESAVGKKGDLNAYGKALEALKGAGNALALTIEDYRAVEDQDADEDGATNGEELNAGTNPSDPASLPGSPQSSLPPRSVNRYLASLAMPAAWADEQAEDGAEEAPKAEYVGTETCAMCHAKEAKEFKHSSHARIAIPGEVEGLKAQGCETCHGPGSLHVDAGGGRGVGGMINPRKDPNACFACHTDKKMQFRMTHHHPVLEGKMSCADCHDAHATDVRPWSATSLHGTNEACFKCHKEQRGPFVFEHEALREGCTECHQVHGSINDKMLVARDANLCLRCHTQVNFPSIGNSGHAGRLPEGTCFSAGCHTAVHGSNFSDHLRY